MRRNSNQKHQAQDLLEDNCYENHCTYTWHIPPEIGIFLQHILAENILSQAGGKQISVLPVSLSQGQIHGQLQSLLLAS